MPIKTKQETIRNRIQKWLMEEGFRVQSLTNSHSSFNILAEDSERRKVNIVQPIQKIDQIVIATKATLSSGIQSKLSHLRKGDRDRILWTLRFGLLNKGVGFSSISFPLEHIDLSVTLYYDGLTKGNFMNKLFEVRKALLFVFWIIDRELGEPEPTIKLAYVD